MNKNEIEQAHQLLENGDAEKLDRFITPFLQREDPYSMYFQSRYSLASWTETSEEFEKRRIHLLEEAANNKVPEALYQLSALYFSGDGVPLDCKHGKQLLEMAAELNYGPALYSIGINSYYGSNGFEKDVDIAKSMMLRARDMGVEGADDYLEGVLPGNI